MTETEGLGRCSVAFGGPDPRSLAGEPDRWYLGMSSDAEIASGRNVHLRPIRPEDAARLTTFHEHLSARSVYLRYFYLHPRLTPVETERLVHVDYVDRLALIGEIGDRLVAVGRYDRVLGTAEAEVAFVVADEFQHEGIGTLLLDRLAETAVVNGITCFTAQTLVDNQAMLAVFLHSGYPVTSSSAYGTVDLRISIGGTRHR